MKLWISTACVVATLPLVAGVVGCSETQGTCSAGTGACHPLEVSKKSTGSVGLQLEIADGLMLNEISFTITGNGIVPIEGTVPVEEIGSTASVQVSGIPEGDGYSVVLEASEDDLTCLGSGTFDIVAAETTTVQLTLNCTVSGDDGTVVVGGGFNICPKITHLSVLPLAALIGNSVALSARARDDNGDGILFSWTGAGGEFGDEAAASTTFTCLEPGTRSLVLTASDGRCEDSATIAVECIELCSNGTVDPGEECDDGNKENGDGCNSSCLIEACGNDRLDFGEECDDGNDGVGDGCDAECLVEECGNARLDFGEECDDGNDNLGDGCDAQCLVEECGNARLDFGEECDDGNDNVGDGCDAECLVEACGNARLDFGEECDDGNLTSRDGCDELCVAEDLCAICVEDNCSDTLAACVTSECEAVLACTETSNCAASGAVSDCYCGEGVQLFTCLNTTTPQGTCRTSIEQGTAAIFPSVVLDRLINADYPAGIAMQYVLCTQQSCGEVCASR